MAKNGLSGKKVFLGCDHCGYKLKEIICAALKEKRIAYTDFSPDFIEGDDYPDSAFKVAKEVSLGKGIGILICGTGIGMSIAANKFRDVRAALVHTEEEARQSRMHNDSNILVLSGNKTTPQLGRKLLKVWLSTRFAGGRHKRRVNKIKKMEKTIL